MSTENVSVRVVGELTKIYNRDGGILRPEAVVKEARSPKSPLHNHFTWDDGVAARLHRLWQARQLISVCIKVIEVHGEQKPTRAFVSLTPDRKQDGGGYRGVVDVLSDGEMRAQLLRDALEEMERFEQKYRSLTELAFVFQAMREAKVRLFRKAQAQANV